MTVTEIPKIKMTYFDMRGRAETGRLCLVVGKIPFEDERLSMDEWKERKASTPFGAMPLLTVDGKVMAQSNAIVRYIGKLGGLYPEDPVSALKVDEILDTITEFVTGIFSYRGGDKEKLREVRAKFLKEDVPRYFGGLEKRLEAFGDGQWAVGDELTVADLAIFNTFTIFKCGLLEFLDRDLLDQFTKAASIYRAVNELPAVVEWYKKHPIKVVN